jgi:hypothetical protein
MSSILTKATVLVLNRNWQAINVRTPQEAFCMMATNVATGLDIERGDGAHAEALRPEEGSPDHVVPRSRGGKDAWENLVWSAKEVNQRKADRLPHEAGLRLLSIPHAPRALPVSAAIRNAYGIEDWKLFVED